MIKFLKQKNRAFTLVETLVAISIFTASTLALIGILSQGITSTNITKKRIVAEYLAQEGIEYIRNMRDTYVLFSGDALIGWNNFNSQVASSCTGNGCFVNADNLFSISPPQQMTKVTLTACSDSNCSNGPLLYDSSTGQYQYTSNGATTNSGFTRKITTTQIGTSPSNETKITSTVYWTQGSGPQSVTFSEDLFNWVE